MSTKTTMKHTGMLFLARPRPHAGTARCGAFQLQLYCVDRIGPHQTEPWRLVWTGPAAKRFWERHERDLKPGAALQVELEHARVHTIYSRPPVAEVHARVITLELVPRVAPARKNTETLAHECTP